MGGTPAATNYWVFWNRPWPEFVFENAPGESEEAIDARKDGHVSHWWDDTNAVTDFKNLVDV